MCVWPPQGSSSTLVSVLGGPPPHYSQVFEVYRPAVPLGLFGGLFVASILHCRLWESPRSPPPHWPNERLDHWPLPVRGHPRLS